MHPFCCISTVSDHSPVKPLPELPMSIASRSAAGVASPHSQFQNQILNHRRHHNNSNDNCGVMIDCNHQNHHHNNSKRVLLAAAHTGSSGQLEPQVDSKINDIVGKGISGILYKWVNYGKGWRPRWFVLQDGVLSYYKIHGPDKIVVNQETEKGSKVIGEESLRRISRPKNGNSHLRRNPVGEVHLEVSTIRESRSDDKRFSIFTGTKRLHLRAETREDRMVWMEAFQAVKDMFPRMSNSKVMAPLDNVAVSTKKLRQRLQEEGVSEAVILDTEQIMRTEYAVLHNQIVLLKQKQWLLIDTLRQLEVHVMKSKKQHAISNQNPSSSSSSYNSTVSSTI